MGFPRTPFLTVAEDLPLYRQSPVLYQDSSSLSSASSEPLLGGRFRLRFREPQRAVTPGQFAVLYDGEDVVGSGVILE